MQNHVPNQFRRLYAKRPRDIRHGGMVSSTELPTAGAVHILRHTAVGEVDVLRGVVYVVGDIGNAAALGGGKECQYQDYQYPNMSGINANHNYWFR